MPSSRPTPATIILLCLSVLLSCTQADQSTSVGPEASSNVKISYVNDIAEGSNARIMIKGMSCERACVSAVTKSVAKVPSVVVSEMKFDKDQAIDTLMVNFDPQKVNEKELIQAVQSLMGGDTYQVTEVQMSMDAKTSGVIRWNERVSGSKNDRSRNRFEVPNFLEILRKVSI